MGKVTPLSLTLKDQKIIEQLYDDARKPFSEIAKKVKLSKEGVAYRVKRMLDAGLLNGFNTILNVNRIGWKIFFMYVRFKRIDMLKEESIMKTLVLHPNIAWQAKCIGNYDAVIKFFARSHEEMDEIAKDIEDQFKNYVDAYELDYVKEEQAVPVKFLYNKQKEISPPDKPKQGVVAVTKEDILILEKMSKNARITFLELSKQLDIPRETVAYRIKRMEKEGIIIKYRPEFWSGTRQQGYNWFFVILKMGKLSKQLQDTLFTYFWNNPHVTFYYKTSGVSDVQVEVRVQNTLEFNKILMELRAILKSVLKRHELMFILDEQKFTYFPNCLKETV